MGYHEPMRRLRIAIFPLVLLVATSCAETSTDLNRMARTSQSTLNAEDNVYDLVARYHEAKSRAAEYAPLVDAEEERLRELREAYRQLHDETKTIATQVDELTKEKEALTVKAEELTAELAEQTPQVAEQQKSLDELTAQSTEQQANLETLQKTLAKQTEDIAATTDLIQITGEEAEQLKASLLVMTQERDALSERMNAIRSKLEELRPKVLSSEGLIKELEKRIQKN